MHLARTLVPSYPIDPRHRPVCRVSIMQRLDRMARQLLGSAPAAASHPVDTLALCRPEPGKAPVAWTRVTRGAEWQSRDSQGEVSFDGKLWIMGGWYQSYGSPPRDVWSSPDGEKWELVQKEAGWRHSDFPMSTVFQGKIFIMGGWTDGRLPTHSASNEVWCSADGEEWTQLTDNAGWSPRLAGGITVHQGKLWVMGGTEDYYFGSQENLKNDVWCSSDGVAWECVTAAAPWSPRGYLRAVTLGDRMYMMGGGNYVFDGDSPGDPKGYFACNDVWSSIDGRNWCCCSSSAPWHPRIWFSALSYRGKLWVLGGWSSSGLAGSNDDKITPTTAPNVKRSTNFRVTATETLKPQNSAGGTVGAQLPDGYFDSGQVNSGNWNWGDVWYSADGVEWFSWEIDAVGWKERHAHSAVVLHDSIYVYGGHAQPLSNEVWRLTLPPNYF